MIRDFKRSDTDALYSIAIESLNEDFTSMVFPTFHQSWPAGQVVACDFLDRPIGFISSVRLVGDVGRIMMFAVKPEYRGRGIGSELLSAFRFRAMMDGIRSLTLEVRVNNREAIRFYQVRGFHPVQLLPCYYNDGTDGMRMDGPMQC